MFKKFTLHSRNSFRHSFFIIPFILVLPLAFSVVSCKEELSGLGADLLPGSDNLPMDSTSVVISSNVSSYKRLIVQEVHTGFAQQTIKSIKDPTKDSTIIIKYDYFTYFNNLLGEYKDEAFGSTKASLLFQLSPSDYHKNDSAEITSKAVFISLTLSLAKSDTNNYLIIGSANSIQKCQIYALKDTIDIINAKPADSSFYSDDNLEHYIDWNRPIQLENEAFVSDNKDFKYRYKFKITDQSLIDKFMGIDTASMKNRGLFNTNILKGFYITSNSTEGGNGGRISNINLASDSTFLELKYRKTASDTVIRSYKFYVSAIPIGLSNYYVENKPAFDTAKYDFLQGLDKRCVKIDLQDLERFRQSPISINKAELILNPDTIPDGFKYSNLPKQIYILAKGENDKDEIIDIDNRRFIPSDIYGGQYINKAYRFNITRYLQNFVKYKSVKNLGLLLKIYNSFSSNYFDAGRLAFKKDGGIKLKIYYTKIK